MNNLRLPEIPQGGPIVSAAGAIDRAGAQIEKGLGEVADVFSEMDRAKTLMQMREANLSGTRALNDTLNFVKSTPYAKPDQVRALFGGTLPPGVKLTEQKVVPGQAEPVEVDREVIPTHEFIPQLFDQQARTATENAAQGIEGADWQKGWKEAFAKDVERARAEAMDWQRAQFHADHEVRTVAQFKQYVAQRDWASAEMTAKDPFLDPKTRGTLIAELPGMKTEANIHDRLRSGDPKELAKLQADIASNNFESPLSAPDQDRFTAIAHARVKEIREEQEHAEKKRYDDNFKAGFGRAIQAVDLARKTGQPASKFMSVADIAKMGLLPHDAENLITLLDSNSKSPAAREQSDLGAYLELSQKVREGTFGKMTAQELLPYLNRLNDADKKHWMGEWQKGQESGGAVKPPFSESEYGVIRRVVEANGYRPTDAKSTPAEIDRWNNGVARAERNLIEWRKNHPGEPLLYDNARTLLKGVFNAQSAPYFGSGTAAKYIEEHAKDGATVSALSVGLSAVKARVTDMDIAEQVKLMEEEAPFVREAWAALNPNEETPLTEGDRALVRSVLMNETETKKIEAQLRAEKKPVNPRSVIFRVVKTYLQPSQNREAADRIEQEMTRKAGAAQVVAKGAEIKSKAAEIVATDEKSFRALPQWERSAIEQANDAFAKGEQMRAEQIRARVRAEVKDADPHTSGYRRLLRPDLNSEKEIEARIAAEAAAGREDRKVEFQARLKAARDGYRKYWESKMVNDDGSTRVIAPPDFLDFNAWLKRNGPSAAIAGAR